MSELSPRKRSLLEATIENIRQFRFCGPSDDPDEQTSVTLGYSHLLTQLQRLAAPILPGATASELKSLDVVVNDLYSAFAASEAVDALLPDIEDALDALDADQNRAINVEAESLAGIHHDAVGEQISKAKAKIEEGDYSGSIASAYTLVEELLKLLLLATGTGFKTTNGDIRSLYRLLRGPMRLDPSDNGINEPLKPILDGFQKLVGGLYEIANKASDRHARQYNPSRHHAKLAVNAAFVLCEFLVESYEYQKAR